MRADTIRRNARITIITKIATEQGLPAAEEYAKKTWNIKQYAWQSYKVEMQKRLQETQIPIRSVEFKRASEI